MLFIEKKKAMSLVFNLAIKGHNEHLDYLQNRAQQFLGRHKSLWWLVSKLKKDTSHYE